MTENESKAVYEDVPVLDLGRLGESKISGVTGALLLGLRKRG